MKESDRMLKRRTKNKHGLNNVKYLRQEKGRKRKLFWFEDGGRKPPTKGFVFDISCQTILLEINCFVYKLTHTFE